MKDRWHKIHSRTGFVNLCLLISTCFIMLASGLSFASDKTTLKDDIRQAILKELTDSVSPNVEISGFRVLKGMEVMNGKGQYKIENVAMNGYSGQNRINFLVNLTDEKSNEQHVSAEVSFDVLTDVFVANKLLNKGTVLSESDFYVTKQKSSRLPARAVSDKKDFEGMTIKSNIAQGVILRADHLTSQQIAKKGQKVEVSVEGDNISILAHGVLKGDAAIGGVVKVLCDVTKKEVSGILVNANTVKVKI